MLKLLRDKGVKKKIYMGLAVAVVASFVVSGLLVSQDEGKSSASLAKFENRRITVTEYLDSYRAVQRQASFMYGDKLNEIRSRINFKNEAWDRLLLLEYAKKQRVRAGDSEVVDWITRQEGFKRDGKFDDAFYRLYVERALKTSPRQFEEEIRQMLTLGQVQLQLEAGDAALTDDKLKELYAAERTEKDLAYGLLPFETFDAQVPVADEAVQKLYDMVKDKLTDEKTGQPLTLEQAKEEVKRKIRLGSTTELALKRLGEVKEKIKSPEDFETILKAEGITVEKLAKYKKGTYPAGIWPSENLQNAVANLDQGEISAVFDVPKGAMIAKVETVHPLDEKKFEEEKKTFQEEVSSRKGREKMEGTLAELRQKLSLNVELMKELFPADT